MKKIAILAAAMMICAGMAFAQSPVKKAPAKANTEKVQPVKSTEKADAALDAKPGCGNCPHHKQCGKSTQTAAKPAANEKKCCSKDGQKACSKNGQKACNKEAATKTANKSAEAKK